MPARGYQCIRKKIDTACILDFIRSISRVLLLFVLLIPPGNLRADENDSGQIWTNLTLSYPKSEKFYTQLAIRPRFEISDEKRRSIDAHGVAEFYPNKWIDIRGEILIRTRKEAADIRSLQFTPRIGIRFYLFENIRDKLSPERLALGRFTISNLLRLEYRMFHYFGDLESANEWRLRNRLAFRFPINNDNMSIKGTLYFMTDVEAFIPLSAQVAESFASKARFRIGLGFRANYNWRIEILYIRDWARDTLEETGSVDIHAIDLRVKVYF